MLGIDLAALSQSELQRLLDASRAKGQAEMTTELQRELTQRRARPGDVGVMSWPPASPALADAPADTQAEAPRHTALVAALAAGAVVASAAGGWWLTHAHAPTPTAIAPAPVVPAPVLPDPVVPDPVVPAPLAPAAAQAPPLSTTARHAAAAPSAKARAARQAGHRHGARRHAHRHARPSPPARHAHRSLLHRLTDWMKPPHARR